MEIEDIENIYENKKRWNKKDTKTFTLEDIVFEGL